MTLATTPPKTFAVGIDAVMDIVVPFQFFAAAEIEVVERTIATGDETVKTLGLHYTVTGGNGQTGTISSVASVPSTVEWHPRRKTSQTQSTDLTEGGALPAESTEQRLDRAFALIQELQEQLTRAIIFPKTDSAGLSSQIPNSIARASKGLLFDATGAPIAGTLVSAGSITVPVPVTEGGTASITAGGARVNLAAAGVGDANTFTQPQRITGNALADLLTLEETNDAATSGPVLMMRRISASPAAGDNIGRIAFNGRDSLGNDERYAQIFGEIVNPADGSESGRITVQCRDLGNGNVDVLRIFRHGTALVSADPGVGANPALEFRRESPSPASGDSIGVIRFFGRDDALNSDQFASIFVFCEDVTSGSEDGVLRFNVTRGGVGALKLQLGNGLYSLNATGGDKGDDSANFKAVFDDNVLLTCYVPEAWLEDGKIDLEKWDKAVADFIEPARRTRVNTGIIDPVSNRKILRDVDVPERRVENPQHRPARRFAARAAELLDTPRYLEIFRTERRVPSMPSPAEWDAADKKMPVGDIAQRQWEALDLLHVHLAKIHERLQQLEGMLVP